MVLTRKEKNYKKGNWWRGEKISLDKREIIYIINNAIILLFEN